MFDSAAIVLPPYYATHPQVINNGLLVLCVCEPLSPAVSLVKGWKVRGRVEHQVEGWALRELRTLKMRNGRVWWRWAEEGMISGVGGVKGGLCYAPCLERVLEANRAWEVCVKDYQLHGQMELPSRKGRQFLGPKLILIRTERSFWRYLQC
jgi:hypothetical protein